MYIGLHIMYPFFLLDFDETGSFSTDFQKHINIKFYEDPSSRRRVVPCGWRERHDESNDHFSQFCKLAQLKEGRKAHCTGHIWPRNCLLKHISEGKIKGTGRQRKRFKQLLNDLNETRRYWQLKQKALYGIL
jgi:hypothetical protein